MVKKIGPKKTVVKEWVEVKNQEKKVWKSLREFLKTKEQRRKKQWEEEKKNLREIRRRVKREMLEKKWRKVTESRDMASFWGAINQFRKKREKRENNIDETRWVEHFSKLLDREEQNLREEGEERGQLMNHGNIEVPSSEDLNKDLTYEEILVQIKKLMEGNAAREDGRIFQKPTYGLVK